MGLLGWLRPLLSKGDVQVKSSQASEVEYAAAVATYLDNLSVIGGSLRRRSGAGLGDSSALSLVQVHD